MTTRRTSNSSVNLTIEQILNGTSMGRTQSVGHMEVIPLTPESAEAVDEHFGPPNLDVGTSNYGSVRAHNTNPDRPTILPLGSSWISSQSAQDHAVGSAEFVKSGETKKIDSAMCVQKSQCGLLNSTNELVILPAPLRVQALAKRKQSGFDRLWGEINKFTTDLGIHSHDSQVAFFINHFKKELDEFVAEFELMQDQVGAIILVGGQVVGIERAPNPDYWATIWNPLIRVCYGALAVKARQVLGDVPLHRETLDVKDKSLAGIKAALQTATVTAQNRIAGVVDEVQKQPLLASDKDRTFESYSLLTVANQRLAGQMVENSNGQVPYISISAAAIR